MENSQIPTIGLVHSGTLLNRVLATCAIAMLLFNAYVMFSLLFGIYIIISAVSPRLYRFVVDKSLMPWFRLAELLMVKLLGVHVRQFGDRFQPQESSRVMYHDKESRVSIILMNHMTEFDWFFAWALGDDYQRSKIVLKDSLANIPGAGWCIQAGGYIFLRRQVEIDRKRIQQIVDYFRRVNNSIKILMFPEGTTMYPCTLNKSNEFASKNNLPMTLYTLHPRTTGLMELVKAITPNRLDSVYDVTVAYPYEIPSLASQFLQGVIPKEVHYHVKRYTSTDIFGCTNPDEGESDPSHQICDWLRSRWIEKEDKLKRYYNLPPAEREFENEIDPESIVFHRDGRCVWSRCTWLGIFNVLGWILVILAGIYVTYNYLFFRISVLANNLLCISLCFIYGGLSQFAEKWI